MLLANVGGWDLDRPGKTWTKNGIHPVTANSPPQRGPPWGRPSLPAPGLQQLTDILSHVRWKGSRLWLIWRTPGMARSIAKKNTPRKSPIILRTGCRMPLQHSHQTTPPSGSNWMILDAFNSITLRKLDSQIANQYINRFNRFNRWMFLVTDYGPASAMIMNMNSRASALGSCRQNPAVAPYDSLWKPENHGINWINMDKPWSNAECWWIYCTPTVTWNI